ncbi:MAG: hypothetical protein EOM20_06820 [Spartobacteria bacterium]|nr:hypothetical protein [Spartobacteria bacterium]
MPVNIVLIKSILETLHDLCGGSLPEVSLAAEVEIRMGRPLTTHEISTSLTLARDKGWVDRRKDDFSRDLWRITDTGINKLRDM